ncbi:MAG TPA: hypothetical protein VMU92_00975 [Acidobacteriaceae bacterium]|nr:hypothetical protein [Acidobacteriaceae bacterium]
MAAYTIRVELKGDPSYEEYEKLHELMAAQGFKRTIRGVTPSGNDATFDLPHATYYGQSSTTTGDLLDSLRTKIKADIQQDIVIFVAKTETWAIG